MGGDEDSLTIQLCGGQNQVASCLVSHNLVVPCESVTEHRGFFSLSDDRSPLCLDAILNKRHITIPSVLGVPFDSTRKIPAEDWKGAVMSVCSNHHDSTRSVPPPFCLKACRLVISKACIEVAKCKPWNCRFWHVRPASHSTVQESSNHRSGLPKTAFPHRVSFRVRPRNCLPDHWWLVGRSPPRAFISRDLFLRSSIR
jgi:hypothetical protein